MLMRKLQIGFGLALGFLICAIPVAAQSNGDIPKLEVSVDYTYLRARTVVATGCCFNMNGGDLSVAYNATKWVGLVGDFGAYYAGNVQNTGFTLSIFPYTFGPRFTVRKNKTFTPYAQALFGGGHAGGTLYTRNFVPPGSKNAFALIVGGGVDANINSHFAIRLAEVDYMFTNFPDGSANHEDHFRLTTGVVFRFGSH